MSESEPREFHRVANHLGLDLVNTERLERGERVDVLKGFAELVAWAEAAGILGETRAREVLARWEGSTAAEHTLATARDLRAAVRDMADRLIAGEPVPAETLAVVNRVLASQPGVRQVERIDGGYRSRVEALSDAPVHLLVPVANSVADLLERAEPAMIKQCENPACIHYFYDTTKNRSRRWCTMEVCGSRAKAAAYYRRKKAAGRGR